MLIVDDLLLSPVTSIFWVFREIANTAEKELASEADNLTARLSELYMRLETGQISEEEFDKREQEILDRLDAISQPGGKLRDEEEEGDESEEEDR